MKCFLFGCKTHSKDPVTGLTTWFNHCPVCNTKLDR